MRLALAFLLLFTLRAFGASGYVAGAWTSTNGGILYVNVTNVSTNGTWGALLPAGSNQKWTGRENALVKLYVTGNGFGAAGDVQTSKTRTLIGTTRFPNAYPATNAFTTSADGTMTTIQIAMSDFVFIGETISADIAAGVYTESAKANQATNSLTVTNNSYINYTNARPVFNWITPQRVLSQGSTFLVEALACHWSSIYDNSGRPVQAIEFRAADENSHSVTQVVTSCTFGYSPFGAGGACYSWNVPTSSFNDTNTITVNARLFPFFGTNATIDTSDGVYTAPSPNYCPLKFLNDPNGTYGEFHANVSTNTGNDATGVVTNLANWTTNVQPFYTIRGAAFAMAKYASNFFGRIDCSGGHIHLEAGGWRMAGTNLGAGLRMPRTYVELLPYPGVSKASCYLQTNLLDTDINGIIKCTGLGIGGTAATSGQIFNVVGCLWTDQCDFFTEQSAPLNIVTNWYSTRDSFYRMAGGLKSTFGASGGPVFIRDALINFTNTTVCLTPIRFRNLKTNLAAAASLTWRPANGSATPARASTIWAYNQTYALSNVNSSTEAWTIERDVIDGVYIGQAFLCNVVEPVGPTTSAFIGMGSGGGTSNMFNLMLFNNTILQKMNSFYDDGTVWPRLYSPTWVVGNFDDDCNIKGDEGSPADGGRYGNRPQIYCVGYSHNLLPETYNIGTPGSFQQGQTDGFPGVNSYATNSIIGSTNTMWKFTRRGSFAITTGVGNGDYRYLSTSPAFQFVGPRVLSHKTDGATTSEVDPPGAFTSGNLRHAGIGF